MHVILTDLSTLLNCNTDNIGSSTNSMVSLVKHLYIVLIIKYCEQMSNCDLALTMRY